MALIKCPDCGTEVSDSAAACPKCARVISQRVSAAPAPAPPAKGSGLWRHSGWIGLLVILGVLYYKFWMPKETKDTINRVASNTGVTITPWIDRADAALRAMIEKQPDTIGKSIIAVCHPTGTYTKVEKWGVRKDGETLVLEMQVGWKGGLVGSAYATQVRWTCNKQGPIKAEVFGDNSVTGVSEHDVKKLDEYLRTQVWPPLYSNTGG